MTTARIELTLSFPFLLPSMLLCTVVTAALNVIATDVALRVVIPKQGYRFMVQFCRWSRIFNTKRRDYRIARSDASQLFIVLAKTGSIVTKAFCGVLCF